MDVHECMLVILYFTVICVLTILRLIMEKTNFFSLYSSMTFHCVFDLRYFIYISWSLVDEYLIFNFYTLKNIFELFTLIRYFEKFVVAPLSVVWTCTRSQGNTSVITAISLLQRSHPE